MVWTVALLNNYLPDGAHPEFNGRFDLGPGAILALDDEQLVDVSRPPLPTVESIFEIKSSDEILEGEFEIDLGADRIMAMMGPKTYELVQKLRTTDEETRVVVMNSLYVPMLMQVLQEVSESGPNSFEQYRWLHPFRARCEQTEIDFQNVDLLKDAHRLLQRPFASLGIIIENKELG